MAAVGEGGKSVSDQTKKTDSRKNASDRDQVVDNISGALERKRY